MSSSTISFEYTWPTFVRICARIRSLLIVAEPVYSTSMARMTGGPGGDGGACARAITAVKSVQREAIQIAIGGGRTHPQKSSICQKRSPTQTKPTQDKRPYSEKEHHPQGEIFHQIAGGFRLLFSPHFPASETGPC